MVRNQSANRLLGIFLLLITVGITGLTGQINREAAARAELERRGIDEAELEQRLSEKGIDLNELSSLSRTEALEIQSEIEETIAEMEREGELQTASNQKVQRINEDVKSTKRDTIVKDSVPQRQVDPDSMKQLQEVDVEIYGQQIFRNQSLKVYNQSKDVKPPSSYVLGPGDEVVVSIWGLSRLDESLSINESGFVSPFKMPRVFLKGFTFAQAKEILKKRYAQYYRFRQNEFDVAINYSRSIEVNIFGEVKNYGGFTLPATNTAFNALVAAGGPTDIGSVRKIKLRRDGELKMIDVYAFMNDPSVAKDFYLQNNDIIQVPVADKVVSIVGAVNRPFKYELLDDETLSDAIEFAGGLAPEARLDRIQISRYTDSGKLTIDVDWTDKDQRSTQLRNGDIVRVFMIESDEENVVSIEGEVDYPGEYSRFEGMTVSDLLQKAVLTPNTRMDLGFIKRYNGDGTVNLNRINLSEILNDQNNFTLEDRDEVIVYARSRYVDSTYFEVKGEVREPGRFLFDASGGLSVYDALMLSGGLTQEAQNYGYIYRQDSSTASNLKYIRVDVRNIINRGNGQRNISILPGDRIVIGSKKTLSEEQYIDVVGAVRQPGRYEYGDGMTLVDVLSLAGGFTFSAASNRIDLFRVEMKDNQATKTIIATVEIDRDLNMINNDNSIELQPFDQIVVREVPEFEFQRNVMIEGEVRYPGPYALTTDNEKLRSVVERAGNLTLEAFPQGATLFRSLDSIGYVVIDLDEAMKNPKSKFNIILKDGDLIQVPKQQDLVRIIGYTNAAQLYPDRILNEQNGIAVPYHARKNARYYIDEFAAGVGPEGDACEITVEHANGQIERTRNYGLFKSYPRVKPGSVIRVGKEVEKKKSSSNNEEKEEVDWGKVFANSVAQATTILSLILLLQRID